MRQIRCENCGARFTAVRKDQRWCSNKCRELARRGGIKKDCPDCGGKGGKPQGGIWKFCKRCKGSGQA